MENFNNPYCATSISDFWRRWHISLSSWFRDYVYIPLGGNRVSTLRWYSNIIVVFLLSGLWHGANWTFVMWGGLHGMYMILSKTTQTTRERIAKYTGLDTLPKLRAFIQVAITFSLVSFAWIFFRANTVGDAFYIVSHLFAGGWGKFLIYYQQVLLLLAIVILLYVLPVVKKYEELLDELLNVFLNGPWLAIRWISYSALMWAILLYGVLAGGRHEFVYFAF